MHKDDDLSQARLRDPDPSLVVQGADHAAEGPLLRPVLVSGVLALDRQDGLLDLPQSRLGQQLHEVASPGTCEVRLVDDAGIELPSDLPEQAQRRRAAGEVPDAGGHGAARPGDAAHLRQAGHRIGHEVDDQLRERRVERIGRERQLLGGRQVHLHAGMARASGVDERLRGIDRGHRCRTQPGDELPGQRAGTAAHVEHAMPRFQAREIRQLRREQPRVAAHESVVGVGGDIEAHRGSLRPPPGGPGR